MKRIFITIYILLLGTMFTIPFGIGPIIDALFEDELNKADRDISRGTFSLIVERFEGMSPDEQREELTNLQPRFGYPLGLYKLSELEIEDEDLSDFLKGLIVDTDDDDMLVMRLGQSNYALAMGGPWPGKGLEFRATVMFLFLFVLFLTLPALAWTFFSTGIFVK